MILTIPVKPDFLDIFLYAHDIEEVDECNKDENTYRTDLKRFISQCGQQKVIPFSQIQIEWDKYKFIYKKNDSYFLDKINLPKENYQQVMDLLVKGGKAHKINIKEIVSHGFEQFKELFLLLRNEEYKINEMKLSFIGWENGKGEIYVRRSDDKNKIKVSVDADDILDEKIGNWMNALYQKVNGQVELF